MCEIILREYILNEEDETSLLYSLKSWYEETSAIQSTLYMISYISIIILMSSCFSELVGYKWNIIIKN